MTARTNLTPAALLEALDESLRSIFGTTTAYEVLYHLEKRGSSGLAELFGHPQEFVQALKAMFGEAGAQVVGSLLEAEFREKLGLDREEHATGSLEAFFCWLKIASRRRAPKMGEAGGVVAQPAP